MRYKVVSFKAFSRRIQVYTVSIDPKPPKIKIVNAYALTKDMKMEEKQNCMTN